MSIRDRNCDHSMFIDGLFSEHGSGRLIVIFDGFSIFLNGVSRVILCDVIRVRDFFLRM